MKHNKINDHQKCEGLVKYIVPKTTQPLFWETINASMFSIMYMPQSPKGKPEKHFELDYFFFSCESSTAHTEKNHPPVQEPCDTLPPWPRTWQPSEQHRMHIGQFALGPSQTGLHHHGLPTLRKCPQWSFVLSDQHPPAKCVESYHFAQAPNCCRWEVTHLQLLSEGKCTKPALCLVGILLFLWSPEFG